MGLGEQRVFPNAAVGPAPMPGGAIARMLPQVSVASPSQTHADAREASLTLLSADAVLAHLQTSRSGLTPAEAALRLRRDGANQLPEGQGPGRVSQLADQFIHFFALMLEIARGSGESRR